MTKKVMDALNKLNEKLERDVVPQIEALGNLIGQTAVDVLEESDMTDEEMECYAKFAKVIMSEVLNGNYTQK